MFLKTKRLVIRDLERKDEEQLFKIVWQKNVVRYMRDWSDNNPRPESFHKFIDWRQSQKDSKDIYENKRYAVALKDIDLLVGVVGMGIEENLNEIEMAYFIDEEYSGNGYATEALTSLFDWCMEVSDIPYLILTIDAENIPSQKVAEKAGFELFEKRTPVSHKQPNMVSDSYYYYRKYR